MRLFVFVTSPLLLLRGHELLDLFRLDWNILHKVLLTLGCNEDVVLDTDAKAFLRNVNTRFNGEHHAGLHRLVEESYIVNVKSEKVTGSVHKIFFVSGPG